jgi:hypothetical protein
MEIVIGISLALPLGATDGVIVFLSGAEPSTLPNAPCAKHLSEKEIEKEKL